MIVTDQPVHEFLDELEADALIRLLRELGGYGHPTPGGRDCTILQHMLAAHLTAVLGDTANAIERFRRLAPTGPPGQLAWGLAEGLPFEKLTLARLLHATGQYDEAIAVATALDQSTSTTYLPFVPESLALRRRAAEAMGDGPLERTLRERLLELGRGDLIP